MYLYTRLGSVYSTIKQYQNVRFEFENFSSADFNTKLVFSYSNHKARTPNEKFVYLCSLLTPALTCSWTHIQKKTTHTHTYLTFWLFLFSVLCVPVYFSFSVSVSACMCMRMRVLRVYCSISGLYTALMSSNHICVNTCQWITFTNEPSAVVHSDCTLSDEFS